jgi:hypothetical protein
VEAGADALAREGPVALETFADERHDRHVPVGPFDFGFSGGSQLGVFNVARHRRS